MQLSPDPANITGAEEEQPEDKLCFEESNDREAPPAPEDQDYMVSDLHSA